MTASVVISVSEFKEMNDYVPFAKTHQEQQDMKLTLLKTVEAIYGDRYYRLKEGTRKAIDMMCWFAAEKGFFFASDDYLAARYGVTDKTVRNISKKLRDHGVIQTIYRRSSTQNGLSAPIHLFTAHPYFDHWKQVLQLSDFQADFQAENAEIPCESKAEQPKKVSTKYLSFNKNLLKILRKENRLGYTFTPKNVPQTFIKAVKPFFDEAEDIYHLWGKAILAYKKFNLSQVLESYEEMVIEAFKQSVFAHKQRKIRKDFNGYFYGTLVRMFTYKKREETFTSHPTIFNWLEEQEESTIPPKEVSRQSWQEQINQLMQKEDQRIQFHPDEIPY
ncbi:helix-turn-helix domain-containing protein [Domibacillus indicus]|uniref:helix-turn-helix domain-containing protein n=1 Tax=Domibacillus indicus TaxID=1437523 RepID=UPI002040980C|nr:helix-turn-helix domain-containing protein [Domibacillus indicus]MCM3789735.1 helix-turn-helix domain-containing protein [Domibacillus indicus]